MDILSLNHTDNIATIPDTDNSIISTESIAHEENRKAFFDYKNSSCYRVNDDFFNLVKIVRSFATKLVHSFHESSNCGNVVCVLAKFLIFLLNFIQSDLHESIVVSFLKLGRCIDEIVSHFKHFKL